MITLTLLHPMQSIPVQSWNFEHESVIRIGRSTDNHVILYSAVVSRHHVEIRKVDVGWEIVNLGANGTYLDGRRITQVPVEDGVIIRLARSGPNVQIHLGSHHPNTSRAAIGEQTVGQGVKQPIGEPAGTQTDIPQTTPVSVPPVPSASASTNSSSPLATPASPGGSYLRTTVEADDEVDVSSELGDELRFSDCCHQYVGSEHLFCLVCGTPLKVIGAAGSYHVVKTLEQDEVSISHLGWRNGKTVVLKTLLPIWLDNPAAIATFEQEAQQLLTINHPSLPKFTEVFQEQEQPYLVMEPVYGRSLNQLIATAGALPQSNAIARILEVCDVLHYLHSQTPPILHQRIKPAHLLQRPGLPNAPLLITGLTPGRAIAPLQATAEYAAPEQQQGHASVATDLYALGPTLVYLLTGKSPEAFYAHREQGFRFYAEYVPGLTAELVAIIRKLTNPEPGERFATTQEVIQVLQQITPLN